MRKLIFALAAASAVSFAVPASAQTFYAGLGYDPSYGYYGGYGYGYPYRAAWGGPRFYGYDYAPAVTVYAAPPVARRYVVVRERPVVRRVVRTRPAVRYGGDAYAAYAYSPVTTYDSPFFGVTLGRGPGYSWWWD
jgi:hypothetical protein